MNKAEEVEKLHKNFYMNGKPNGNSDEEIKLRKLPKLTRMKMIKKMLH